MSTPRSLRRRGQSGLTIIEMLIAISVGTIVLLPMFGLVSLIILRQEPTIKSSNSAKQLRLFRSTMEKDWAAAKVIKIGVVQANAAGVECNQGNMTSVPYGGNPVTGPLIAIQTSGSNSKRIVYNTRPNTSTSGGIDILRRECYHVTDIIGGLDYWKNGTKVTDPGGSQEVIVEAVQSITIPATCNLQATFPKALPLPPYEMCDMNITVVGRDGQSSTMRLYQHAGRDS